MVNEFIRSLRHEDLTTQQKRTLKGQALSGDLKGAQKGLERIKKRMGKPKNTKINTSSI